MKTFRVGMIAAALLAASTPALSQQINLIEQAVKLEGNCQNPDKSVLKLLVDGDPTTGLSARPSGLCEFVFRFDETVVASNALLNTIDPEEGKANAANLITIWGSHQSFGNAFYKLGQRDLSASSDGIAVFSFDEAVKLRSLKVIMEKAGKGGWEKHSNPRDVRLTDIALIGFSDADTSGRWPQPPVPPLSGKSDPLADGQQTRCDELAGFPYNPDSNGLGRSDTDINVPEALSECEIAISRFPESMRLAANLARVELLGERNPRAIARLTSPLLVDYAPAQYLLAQSFDNGSGVQKDEQRAVDLYKKSAAQDFGPALYHLAKQAVTEKGKKIASEDQTNVDGSVEPNLKRAIEIGYLPAASEYFEHALKYDLIKPKEAYSLLEAATEQGDAFALGNYSTNLHNAYRIRQRATDSLYYELKHSQLNDFNAMTNYSRGRSAKNWEYWRRRGAYAANFYTLEHLAKMLEAGERRQFLSELSFEKAMGDAKDGDHWAMEWVAQYYISGFGVEKSLVEARVWRCRARTAGNPLAIVNKLPDTQGQSENATC
ncbi:MAG: hypothetical protein AAF423_10415 [Pseudomonadota bacterium]